MSHTPSIVMVVENDPMPRDTRVWGEALALRQRGFEVCAIAPKGPQGRYDESYSCLNGIHIYRYSLPSGESTIGFIVEYFIAFVMTCWLCLRVWRRHGIDVVHVANPPDIFFPLGWLLHIFGKRFVFDQHDLSPELFEVLFLDERHANWLARLMHRFMLLCERLTYQTSDLVIVTNETFRRIAIKRGRRPENHVVVVRNGPRMNGMQEVTPEPALKMGKPYLLAYLGVMGAQDGVDYAIRALARLVHTRGRNDVALALLGTGAEEEALRSLTHDLGLDACVHFTGWVEQDVIARYLTTADIGVSPDPRNRLNDACTMIKTMEYMAYGMPVVAFDLTETRFSAQGAALYAQPNLVEDFAAKIEILLDDATLRSQMGAVGRRRIEDALSWEHSEYSLIAAYRETLGVWPTQGQTVAWQNGAR